MKKKANELKFSLNVVFVEDKETGYYSALFEQFPDAIAQGDTKAEALNNLFEAVQYMLNDQKEAVQVDNEAGIVTTQTLNLVTA